MFSETRPQPHTTGEAATCTPVRQVPPCGQCHEPPPDSQRRSARQNTGSILRPHHWSVVNSRTTPPTRSSPNARQVDVALRSVVMLPSRLPRISAYRTGEPATEPLPRDGPRTELVETQCPCGHSRPSNGSELSSPGSKGTIQGRYAPTPNSVQPCVFRQTKVITFASSAPCPSGELSSMRA